MSDGRDPPRGRFGLVVTHGADRFTIAPRGELDIATVDELRVAIDRAERSGAAAIRVDLAALDFIDSSGVRELLRLHQRSTAASRTLSIVPGGRAVQRVFAVAGLLDVLPFGG